LRLPTLSVTTTVAFSEAEYRVDEGGGMITVTLLMTPPVGHPVTATISTSTINATAPDDYAARREIDVIPVGAQLITMVVPIVDDLLVEGEERFLITLSRLEGAQTGVISETQVLIQDNDTAYLSAAPVAVDERAGLAVLTIVQSVTSTLESIFDYRTVDGSALAEQDYRATFGTATIPPGSTQVTITFPITNDTEVEPEESFGVHLLDPTNASLAQTMTVVTLQDDDGLPRLTIGDTAVDEAAGILAFPVALDMSWANTVTVGYATGDGTATGSEDYLVTSGELLLPPGVTTGTIPVQLISDAVPEPDETVVMVLATPVQAQLVVTRAEGIIHDEFYRHTYLPALIK
jgi:hypothetical protein